MANSSIVMTRAGLLCLGIGIALALLVVSRYLFATAVTVLLVGVVVAAMTPFWIVVPRLLHGDDEYLAERPWGMTWESATRRPAVSDDTELVHVELIAERPRRHRGRRGVVVLVLVVAIAAVVAVLQRRASA